MAGNKIIIMITLAGKTQLNQHVACGNAVITTSQDRTYLLFTPSHSTNSRLHSITGIILFSNSQFISFVLKDRRNISVRNGQRVFKNRRSAFEE